MAGLRLIELLPDGVTKEIPCKDFTVEEAEGNQLLITWQLQGSGTFTLHFFEDRFEVVCKSVGDPVEWALELTAADDIQLPFTNITAKRVDAVQDGFTYHITCKQGLFKKPATVAPYVLRIVPADGKVVVSGRTKE